MEHKELERTFLDPNSIRLVNEYAEPLKYIDLSNDYTKALRAVHEKFRARHLELLDEYTVLLRHSPKSEYFITYFFIARAIFANAFAGDAGGAFFEFECPDFLELVERTQSQIGPARSAFTQEHQAMLASARNIADLSNAEFGLRANESVLRQFEEQLEHIAENVEDYCISYYEVDME